MRNFRVLSFAEQAKVCAANFYFVESNFVLTNRHSSYARLTEQRNFRFCDPELRSGSESYPLPPKGAQSRNDEHLLHPDLF